MEFISCLIDRLKVIESNGEYLDWASCCTFLKIDLEFQIKKFVHLIQRSTKLAIILLEKNLRRNGIFLAIGNFNSTIQKQYAPEWTMYYLEIKVAYVEIGKIANRNECEIQHADTQTCRI